MRFEMCSEVWSVLSVVSSRFSPWFLLVPSLIIVLCLFAVEAGLLDSSESHVTARSVEMIFQTTTFEEDRAGDRTALTFRGLKRSQWLEVLLRIAESKYLRSGFVRNLGDAIACLIDNHLKQMPKRFILGADHYRMHRLYLKPISEALQVYKVDLYNIFTSVASRVKTKGKEKLSEPRSRLMGLAEWLNLMRKSQMLTSAFTRAEAVFIFAVSSQRVAEPDLYENFDSMLTFTDFLEALVRVSDMKMSLRRYGVQRTESGEILIPDVSSDVEEGGSQSDSDDEYGGMAGKDDVFDQDSSTPRSPAFARKGSQNGEEDGEEKSMNLSFKKASGTKTLGSFHVATLYAAGPMSLRVAELRRCLNSVIATCKPDPTPATPSRKKRDERAGSPPSSPVADTSGNRN